MEDVRTCRRLPKVLSSVPASTIQIVSFDERRDREIIPRFFETVLPYVHKLRIVGSNRENENVR